MAKKKTAAQRVEPQDGGPDEVVPGETVSISDAIRKAIAAGHAGPQEGIAWINRQFGMTVNPGTFSAVKANDKKREGKAGKSKPGRKPKSQSVEGQIAPPVKSKPAGEEGDVIAALESLKPLVASMGVEKVKRLADLLG